MARIIAVAHGRDVEEEEVKLGQEIERMARADSDGLRLDPDLQAPLTFAEGGQAERVAERWNAMADQPPVAAEPGVAYSEAHVEEGDQAHAVSLREGRPHTS